MPARTPRTTLPPAFRLTRCACLVAAAVLVLPEPGAAQPQGAGAVVDQSQQSPQRRRFGRGPRGVYKARLDPNWLRDGSRFWYRNDLADDQREFVLVDAEKGEKEPAFDHAKLAAALSEATEDEYDATSLPVSDLDFSVDGRSMEFTLDGRRWTCDLQTYACADWGDAPEADEDDGDRDDRFARFRDRARREGRDRGQRDARDEGEEAPNGEWTALVRDGNVYVRAAGQQDAVQLSHDGEEGHEYGMLEWAPDSQTLVAFRIRPGERKEVHLIESSPDGGGRARLHSRPYPLPGDRFTSYELNLFNVETKEHTKPEVDVIDFRRPRLRWYPDDRHFAYEKVDRGHQRLRVIRVDSHTGDANNIIDEQTDTFIWTAHTENLDLDLINWLDGMEEVIYVSEQDGWRHLYLIDAVEGGTKHQITSGEYVVRGIDEIDEENRQIWFSASGKNADQDPYFVHHYRVDFSGENLVALTEGNGNHSVQYSPDRKYVVDSYSRVDTPPVHELRRTSDGSLVCELEEADISELKERGWNPLEVFHAKGRDGETDIWGVICRPSDFDPNKKYPVLENIYAGPQGSFVPKSFSARNRYQSMADLGFIVVKIDGMGTANRSKAFHDVCWHNLKDGGFPDRILWMKAAAEDRPYMDLSRVGVYGGSAGGQNAAAGVLFHPDFYKAAVAGCGCHDNRMDKASWNEQWMGYPVGPQYSECSNIDNAHRLEGKLMLIVGEMDRNVPPESTVRLVDALIEADKDFDYVFVPGAGHGMGGEYGSRRMRDFFVEHLIESQATSASEADSGTLTEEEPDAPSGEAESDTAAAASSSSAE